MKENFIDEPKNVPKNQKRQNRERFNGYIAQMRHDYIQRKTEEGVRREIAFENKIEQEKAQKKQVREQTAELKEQEKAQKKQMREQTAEQTEQEKAQKKQTRQQNAELKEQEKAQKKQTREQTTEQTEQEKAQKKQTREQTAEQTFNFADDLFTEPQTKHEVLPKFIQSNFACRHAEVHIDNE